jgi:hypothetical protein
LTGTRTTLARRCVANPFSCLERTKRLHSNDFTMRIHAEHRQSEIRRQMQRAELARQARAGREADRAATPEGEALQGTGGPSLGDRIAGWFSRRTGKTPAVPLREPSH